MGFHRVLGLRLGFRGLDYGLVLVLGFWGRFEVEGLGDWIMG